MGLRDKKRGLDLEEALRKEWEENPEIIEVPLQNKSLFYIGLSVALVGILVIIRILFLGIANGKLYSQLAEKNLNLIQEIPAPRGLIYGRYGEILAENQPSFSVFLDLNNFYNHPELREETLKTIGSTLGISADDISQLINQAENENGGGRVLLAADVSQEQAVQLKAVDLPAIVVQASFKRVYPDGEVFSSFLGYSGIVDEKDLKADPNLTMQDFIGKAGLELSYDNELRGQNGEIITKRDARGQIIGQPENISSQIGSPLHLTVDANFQKYFYQRMSEGLDSLGRTSGVGLALNPQNGEILALLNFPTYDSNLFEASDNDQEKQALLNSPDHSLFDRAISGLYSPGSTIKPLVAVAALSEGIINTQTTVFSPGYLDIPNPYDPSKYTRYLDWRYQGTINLYSALAQSSDVYFYEVGGGFPGSNIKGLGITNLDNWWQKFNLGGLSSIDLPGEAKGFLPTVDWFERTYHQPWLLGNTYNVSIGQGDLLVTPIGLLDYIVSIANGGRIYQPHLKQNASGAKIIADLSSFKSAIEEVQKGMILGITSPLGTAYSLHDLPFPVAAKTGSAQVDNNEQENAFFVGYTPLENPQIAILVLVEHSKQGSLNTVPIAKDVLNWYYENRIIKK